MKFSGNSGLPYRTSLHPPMERVRVRFPSKPHLQLLLMERKVPGLD